MENNNSGSDIVSRRSGSKRTASSSPRASAFSPRNQGRKNSRNDGESGDDYPKSSSPLRSPLSPSKQNGNRSSRDPAASAWSKPLVRPRDVASRRSLDLPVASYAAAAASARPARDEGSSVDADSTAPPPSTRQTLQHRGAGDAPPSLPMRRTGSPDSGMHSSPAPSSSNRSSEERNASRSRTNSGSSSSFVETISTMNESKDWSSIVEDRELLECELAEHVDRVHEKLVMRGDHPVPTKEELMTTMETDIEVIARRKKQISYGKNTKAYSKYIQTVPKYCRTKGVHPMTPDKYKKLSRRSFDALVKRWKQEIATWDPTTAGQTRSAASSLNSSLEGSASEPTSSIVLRSRDMSKKRPLEESVPVSSSGACASSAIDASIDETSQDSCASTVELMSEASLASPVKKSHIAKDVDEANAGPSLDLRLRLRSRLADQS